MNVYELILGVVTLIFSGIITPVIIYILHKKSNAKVDTVEKKLDANFEQANGHFTKLLDTTAKLAKVEGKAEEKAKHKSL